MVKHVSMSPEGPMFSELVQGYWRMADWGRSAQEHLSFLKQHVELGITTVDHAHVYAFNQKQTCEELFGQTLALDLNMREQIQIVSKCGIELFEEPNRVNHYDSSPSKIVESVDLSLKRLRVEQLDVLLIHRPDWLMDVDAMAQTFSALTQAGKVAHFGVSNFTGSQLRLLQSRLDLPLVTNQVEINPLYLDVVEGDLLDELQILNVRPMAWSCLAGGRLFRPESPREQRLNACLSDVANEIGTAGIDEIAYAWVMSLPAKPLPIVGSGNIDRVKAAVNALKISLSREQWYRIWVASKGQNVP